MKSQHLEMATSGFGETSGGLNVTLPFCVSLRHSGQSCAVDSPPVMSKGLQGRRDKSFISRDQPHHAAQRAASSDQNARGLH